LYPATKRYGVCAWVPLRAADYAEEVRWLQVRSYVPDAKIVKK
jgi:hypothetical protein